MLWLLPKISHLTRKESLEFLVHLTQDIPGYNTTTILHMDYRSFLIKLPHKEFLNIISFSFSHNRFFMRMKHAYMPLFGGSSNVWSKKIIKETEILKHTLLATSEDSKNYSPGKFLLARIPQNEDEPLITSGERKIFFHLR